MDDEEEVLSCLVLYEWVSSILCWLFLHIRLIPTTIANLGQDRRVEFDRISYYGTFPGIVFE
jgi:hypothetical protein